MLGQGSFHYDEQCKSHDSEHAQKQLQKSTPWRPFCVDIPAAVQNEEARKSIASTFSIVTGRTCVIHTITHFLTHFLDLNNFRLAGNLCEVMELKSKKRTRAFG